MSKHKREDPWAGFVDVLSNILMVVIFLVVILGVAIFALSQQITKAAVDQAVQAEREKKEATPAPKPPSGPPSNPKPEATPKVDPQDRVAEAPTAAAASAPSEAQPPQQTKEASSAEAPPDGPPARQLDPMSGGKKMEVRSLATQPTREIAVIPEESAREEVKEAEIAMTAHALISLRFQVGSYRISAASSEEICKALTSDVSNGPNLLEVRASVASSGPITTDARRIAYYRGMQTRGELVKCGIPESRIAMRIRVADTAEENELVKVFLKP